MFTKGNNITISVDDFGISQKTNENTLRLLEAGMIDRIAVMVYGTITQEDIAKLLASGVQLDLHTDLRKTIDPKRKLKDGAMGRGFLFLWNYIVGDNRPAHVENLWEEQILLFQTLFKKFPDGINAHEQVHFFPPYFNILLHLSQKYNIRYIRFGRESLRGGTVVSFIIHILRKLNTQSFIKSGRISSDIMLSFDWIKDIEDLRKYRPNKKIEIIFHPERDEEMTFLENLERGQ